MAILIVSPTIVRSEVVVGIGDIFQRMPQSDLLKEARLLVERNELTLARESLQKLSAENSDLPHVEILLAQLLQSVNRAAEAQQIAEALAVEAPNRLDVRVFFARAAVAQSRWFDAGTHLAAAKNATIPKNWSPEFAERMKVDVALLKATYHEHFKNWQAAREIYLELIADDPTRAQVFTSLGRTEFYLSELDSAAKRFEKAFELDPNREVADLAIASLMNQAGRPEEAEQHFRAAITHPDPQGQMRARLSLARWLLWNNRPEEIAEIVEKKSTDDDAMDKDRQLLLGMSLRMMGRFSEAVDQLAPLHRESPAHFTIGNEIALAMIETDDESLRSRAFQIAELNVRNHPSHSEAWCTLGWIQFRLGDLNSANQSFRRGIASGVISRDTAWQMGQLQRSLGNTEQAEKLVKSAVESTGPFFCSVLISSSPPSQASQ